MLLSLLMLVFLLLLALLLLALLHYESCSKMSLLLLFFPRPCRKSLPDSSGPRKEAFCIPKCRKSLPVPGMRPFSFPHSGKFWSLEPGQVSLQGPDFYGMEECKMSHSRDRKTFPAFGNVKGLLPEEFSDVGECEKDLQYGWREKFPGINSGIINPW
jgi:hypothetical protein